MAGESQPQEPAARASGADGAPPIVPTPTSSTSAGDPSPPGYVEAAREHACFSTLDVTRVRRTLARLHEQVSFGRGRVEIKKRGCDDVCVIISKAELEALESALEIMSASAEYKAMCETLAQVAADVGGYVAAGA